MVLTNLVVLFGFDFGMDNRCVLCMNRILFAKPTLTIYFSMSAVDYASNQHMTDEELLDIVRTVNFDEFGDRDNATKEDKLVSFFLKYARQVCPKDSVMTKWREAQVRAFGDDPQAELGGDFSTLTCYQSAVEIAASVWHYVNSYKDWVTIRLKSPTARRPSMVVSPGSLLTGVQEGPLVRIASLRMEETCTLNCWHGQGI